MAFQNCGVRRQTQETLDLNSYNDEYFDDEFFEEDLLPADSGSTTIPTGPTGGPTPGPTPAVACMIDSALNGSVMGIAGQPPVQSSYTSIIRNPPTATTNGSVISLLTSTSVCVTKSTSGGLVSACPVPTTVSVGSTCVNRPQFTIYIQIRCDRTSDTSSDCPNFASRMNTPVPIDQTTFITNNVRISATYVSNSCDTSAGTTYYRLPTALARRGTFTILGPVDLAIGGGFSVSLSGVELIKDGTDVTKAITLNGTYAGENVNFSTCQ